MFQFANPKRFMNLSSALLPWFASVAAIALAMGLYLSFAAPPDYQQGDTVRIMETRPVAKTVHWRTLEVILHAK